MIRENIQLDQFFPVGEEVVLRPGLADVGHNVDEHRGQGVDGRLND